MTTVIRRTITLLIVLFGWVMFRATDISKATTMWQAMIFPDGNPLHPLIQPMLTTHVITFMLVGTLVAFLPGDFRARDLLVHQDSRVKNTSLVLLMLVAFPYALMLALSGTFSPFLYFQF